MKLVCTATMLKQMCSRHSGWENCCHNQKKPVKSRSNVKVMLIVFLDWKSVIHYEFVPLGETVNREFYLNVLKHLREAVRRKRPEAWTNNLDAAPWQCTCSCITPYPWIFDEAWDDCCPPATLLSRFGPCRLFLVPEVEILAKRLLISDCRGVRRKFDTGPLHLPAKQVPGHVPELEKPLGAVCQEWRGVLWRRHVWLSYKYSNKFKKNQFLYGLPSYVQSEVAKSHGAGLYLPLPSWDFDEAWSACAPLLIHVILLSTSAQKRFYLSVILHCFITQIDHRIFTAVKTSTLKF